MLPNLETISITGDMEDALGHALCALVSARNKAAARGGPGSPKVIKEVEFPPGWETRSTSWTVARVRYYLAAYVGSSERYRPFH